MTLDEFFEELDGFTWERVPGIGIRTRVRAYEGVKELACPLQAVFGHDDYRHHALVADLPVYEIINAADFERGDLVKMSAFSWDEAIAARIRALVEEK